jgi:hypothetical protein
MAGYTDGFFMTETCAPAGDGNYVVQPGEGLAAIAYAHGFFWQTLWDLAPNAALRSARTHQELLLPGDRVTVPELRPKAAACTAGKRHVFRRLAVPARLRFVVAAADGTRFAGKAYVLEVDGARLKGTTGEEGDIDVFASPAAASVVLQVWLATAGYPKIGTWTLPVGHIGPIGSIVGVQRRLQNLAFDCGGELGAIGPRTRSALQAFQQRYTLTATGEIDDATRSKLLEVYGF